jgi:hypothetical protein
VNTRRAVRILAIALSLLALAITGCRDTRLGTGPFQSQANIPIFNSQSDLTAYAPDGILPGMLAVTSSPPQAWVYSAYAAEAGVTGIPSAKGGFWTSYGSSPTTATAGNVSYSDASAPFLDAGSVQGAIDLIKPWAAPVTVSYAPGCTTAPLVYSDLRLLTNDVGGVSGPLTIAVDTRCVGGAAATPAVGTYAFASEALTFASNLTVTDASPDAPPKLSLGTNVFITAPPRIYFFNLDVSNDGATVPFQLVSSATSTPFISARGGALLESTGGQPLVKTTGNGTYALEVVMGDSAYINTPATDNTDGGAAASGTIQVTGTGFLVFQNFGHSTVDANSIAAPTAAQIFTQPAAEATIATAQSGIADTHTMPAPFNIFAHSDFVRYAPSVTGNWAGTAPALVSDALNRVAAERKDAGRPL